MQQHSGFRLQQPDRLAVRIASITPLTPEIAGLELVSAGGCPLPSFTAGAHLDLHLPGGIIRSYSLVNEPGETDRYELAVKREAGGRGGSLYLHDRLERGDILEISPPRNNFLLEEDAPCSVLFAGGIGITPILCMAQRLSRLGRPFRLHYGARSRTEAAFVDRLNELRLPQGSVIAFHFEDEDGGQRIDFQASADAAPSGSHFYCCGPAPMIAAFEAELSGLLATRLHREHFSGSADLGRQGGFEVVLARSGRTVSVPEGTTILDALLDEGISADFSCMEGFCGSCRVGVIEGDPVHKDTVLGPAERAANKVMMICCSTAAGERLVLDL